MHYEAVCGRDEWRELICWPGSSFEGSLQVHVDTQHFRHQLPLILVEALKDILKRRTAPVHPGGKQAGGAEAGGEILVMV